MKCLLPNKIEDFKKALKEKNIKIADLLNMTSEARTTLLEKYAGENAKDVNLLFEEKLVLKNRMNGIKNWASKMGEIGRYDPAKKAKLAELQSEYRAKQQERIFSPKENETFLRDLAEEKIGTRISREEAITIFEMTSKADTLKESYDTKTNKWSSEKTRIEYATQRALTQKYTDDLVSGNLTIKDMLKGYSQEVKLGWAKNKPKTVAKFLEDVLYTTSKTLINSVASWDNSFLGRQGAITLVKSPKIWWNMASESFKDFGGALGGAKMQTYLLKEEMMSRPNGMKGHYDTAKLFPKSEEEIQTRILERIPVIGRVFKASDTTFTNSAIRARTDLFDMMINAYEKAGITADKTTIEDIGDVVNTITARGKLGQIGTSKIIQLTLWAPRMLKADWNILTAHSFGSGLETNFARKQAFKTIVNVVMLTAAIVAIAEAMGAEVEKNPLSSDFMKIKIGNTRINIPFVRGMPQIITLLSRTTYGIAGKPAVKSTSTGIISKLNTGEFGSTSVFDVGMDFLVNKTNPPVRIAIDQARGKNFAGKKPTLESVAVGLLPISLQTFMGLEKESTPAAITGAFLNLIGIGSSTYSMQTDWGENTGKELQQFKEKIGEEKFQEENDSFNSQVNDWLTEVRKNPEFLSLSEDDKKKVVAEKKDDIKKDIFKSYRFKYKQEKSETLPDF